MTAASAIPTSSDRSICILGLGLIGGSLMRALQISGHHVFGYNRSAATVEAAVASDHDASTDLVATLERAAADDAVIVLATPVTTIEDLLGEVAAH
ncbi:MAG: NAD(P)-binding domain-containing protein, partial [Actinomycetota bacterium]|nr:NAD(P)-binding domain-containing protein [Actinomycetota bacterium]